MESGFTPTGERRIDQFLRRLNQSLEMRAKHHGFAYVNEHEARVLTHHNLRQPGHTIYRYSVPNEDLSDQAQTAS